MRSLMTLLCVIGLVIGSWYLWNYNADFRNLVAEYVDNGEFLTLEARYTPQQIMEAHKKELLIDNQHTFEEPELKFHPYLLMEVKYISQDKKTREGVILWSLVDGEMVINTETWEKSHGFEDAIQANASSNEFKILNALAKNNGSMTRDQLQKELHLDAEVYGLWIENARQKHLITLKGDLLQLHFQDPKILVTPHTKINQWLVTKPYNHAQRVRAKYDRAQIEKISLAAFGSDFSIRNSIEVFLPVYSIEVLNPDGSVLTSFWNALNGQRIQPKYRQ
jgi:hypothetical protein